MNIFLFVSLVLGFASCDPEFHRVKVHFEEKTATEDLLIDENEKYVMVTVGHVDIGPFNPSVNIHDMKSGFSAFKNIQEGKCIISPLNSTMPEVVQRIHDIEAGLLVSDLQHSLWNCSSQPMPYEMLERVAGPRIAHFCKSYQSFLSSPISEQDKTRRAAAPQTQWLCLIFCGRCW